MTVQKTIILVFLAAASLFGGCYSFKGISIDYSKVKTFSLGDFNNDAPNVVPTLSQELQEALRLKILSESRLGSIAENGDIEFRGTITNYDITTVAPQPGETTAFNRLTIKVMMEFENRTDPEANWNQSFEWFADYGANENLNNVQENLHRAIIDNITENIFNKAFTNW